MDYVLTGSRGKGLLSTWSKEGDHDMKKLLLALIFVVTTAFFEADLTLAAEYFVVKSRSGILRVVDHQPRGGAAVVQGPFKTREEAEKAIKSSTDTEAPDAKR